MKGTLFYTLLACALMLGLAVSAVPQDMPKPGPEHKKLEYFAGTWEFNAEMKPGPMGPGGKVQTKDTCEWFEGGFALVCRGSGTNPMGATKSMGVMSYDMDKKAYTYYGVETGAPPVLATGKVNGKEWVYHAEGGGMKSRVTIVETSASSYTFKYEMSHDGSTWMTVMEGTGKKSST